MLDHLGLRTTKLDELVVFYESALMPLGYRKLYSTTEGAAFGTGMIASIWLVATKSAGKGVNLAFRSPTRKAIDDFYEAAIAGGAVSMGAPGLKQVYHPSYYAAFVVDPDGNNLSAVCHEAA
jgi:catechol 2,3-dioxygenase-like lactoylglutathione lyase family enzyme